VSGEGKEGTGRSSKMIRDNENIEIPEGFKMTELGPLPVEWDVVRLGEVVKTYSGGTPKRDKTEYWNGKISWLKSGELNDRKVFSSEEYITKEGVDNSSAKFVEENNLLIAMYGATAGKVGLAKSRFTINQAICAIVPNENFYSEFYFYYLMKIRNKLLGERFGGAQPNLNQQIIKNTKIPLPPLPEQKAIAFVLSTIQNAKEKTEAVINATKELKKSLMKHLFTYGPVSVKEAKNVKLKETEIGMVPEEWDVVRLGDVVIREKGLQRGPWGGSIKKEIFVSEGYQVYEQGNVINNNFNLGSYFIDEKKFNEMKDFEIKPGDILITAAGTLGKLAIVPKKIKRGIINQALLRVRLNGQKISKIYFKYFFNNIVEKGIIAGYAHGATLKNLSSLKVLRSILLKYPSLEIQGQIASILSTIDKKIEAEENKKKALEELFKTLLSNLMTGKIRVNNLELEA